MIERATIEDRLRKKETEIQQLEDRLRTARIYVQALRDVLKASDTSADSDVRPGSMLDQAREAIRKAGKPLHVSDILRAIGRPEDSKNSLTGSLAAYVRREEIFTRPAPNTFGLVEFDQKVEAYMEPTPPSHFGLGNKPRPFDDDLDEDVPF
jgi:hypothetical protein